MAYVAAYTGLRWGELTALAIDQVDQDGRTITVDRKIIEIGGTLHLEPPKGRKKRRTIYPRQAPGGYPLASNLTDGMVQLLNWACGVTAEGPLTRAPVLGRPSLYQMSLDVMHAMAGLEGARETGAHAVAGRMEGMIETFAWLAGWEPDPPVDRHGHVVVEECAERDAPCSCEAAGTCLRHNCPACRQTSCVHGFYQDLAI